MDLTTTSAASDLRERVVGCAHHVALSVVGVERVTTGFHRGAVAQEERVEAGSGGGAV